MKLKDILIGSVIAAASCTPITPALHQTTPVENITGKKPVIEYFFAPSCKSCENAPYVIESFKRTFGNAVNFEAWCVESDMNRHRDRMICEEKYGQNVLGGENRLSYLGIESVPAFVINGEQVKSPAELCAALGYEKNCLGE